MNEGKKHGMKLITLMALYTKGIAINKSPLSPTVSFLQLFRIYKHEPSIQLLKDPVKNE